MSSELDAKILEPFREIFAAMDITDNQLKLSAENFSSTLTPEELRELSEGKTLDGKILSAQAELTLPLATFKYKDNIVLVYHRDQYLTRKDYARGKLKRFHLCFCQALRDAKNQNRYESRYVMTFDTSGNFLVNLFLLNGEKREQNVYRRLKVCQHCLRELNWKNFRKYCGTGQMTFTGGNRQMRQKIVDEFDIAEFLLTAKENRDDFPTLNCASVTPVKKYVLDPKIKDALKRNVDFTCEICRRQFPPDELEIHHVNHNQGDNRRANLQVVCKSCHEMIHRAEGGVFTKRKARADFPDVQKFFFDAAALKILSDISSAKGYIFAAKEFRRRAIEAYRPLSANDLNALFELANLCLNFNPTEARRLFDQYVSRAANGGVRELIRVALIFAKGLGTVKNLTKARKFFDAARQRGTSEDFICREFIELCRTLGEVDEAQRLHGQMTEIFEAAQRERPNDAQARYELGKLYGNKHFITEIDENLTRQLFNAAEKILLPTSERYEKIQRTFDAVKQGDWQSVTRLKEAARAGEIEAQATLELLYADADEDKNHSGVLVLREGITKITAEQFKKQSGITHVVFPESLIEIGDEAFKACGLKILVLPAALRKIGKVAFQDSNNPVVEVIYHRRIEWRLKRYFGDRWNEIKKTPLP